MENNFDIKTTELEFKYDASDIGLAKFNEFAESLKPEYKIEVGSWDVYFAPTKATSLPFEFLRLRLGTKPELTMKIKLDEKNNNNRIEIDLPLNPAASQEDLLNTAKAFCNQFGFDENFRIYKYCSIYFYEKLDIVYYIAYNQDMKEEARFVEIEALKSYPFASQEEAMQEIKNMEQKMAILGLSAQKRMKKSMWERFRKNQS